MLIRLASSQTQEVSLDKFLISSTGVSMNYMPHYMAKELGYFADVNLDVESYVPDPWTKVLADIDSGQAHAVEGGIWVPLIYMDRIKNYKAFAKVASRCPFAVASRKELSSFSWKCLEDKTVLVPGGNGASASVFVQGCLSESDADVSRVQFVHDFTAKMLVELFNGGLGDFIILQPDLAAQIAASGAGFVVADLTVHGGPVPWSVYYGTPEFLDDSKNLAGRFALALQRATTWILEHDGADCAGVIRKKWPKVDVEAGVRVINHFRSKGMWTPSAAVDAESLNRWQKFWIDGNMIDQLIPYDRVVDFRPMAFAEERLRSCR